MQLKSLTKLFVVFSVLFLVGGCKGPKVRSCFSKPSLGGLQCHDERDDRQYAMDYEEAEGFTCKDSSVEQELLALCKSSKCLKEVKYTKCEIKPPVFGCKRPDGSLFDINYSETDGYVCRPVIDEQTLLDYCNAKAGCL